MNLVVFLPLGGSLTDQKSKGQFGRFHNYYLKSYAKSFNQVFVVSYANEQTNLGNNITVLPNKKTLHRFIWHILLQFHYKNELSGALYRVMQLDGLLPAILSKYLYGGKVVVTYGYDYQKFALSSNKKFQAYFYFFYENILLPLSDQIIVPNISIYENFKTKPLLRNKLLYLPNSVDTTKFKPASKKKLAILSVGRLEKQKNYEFLINSIAKIPKLTLTIVGNGTLKDRLIKIAKNKKVNLTIIDKIDNEQLPKIYASHSIFVSSSLFEGSPKALLEAMSSGCCVLVSNVEGNKEMIEDNTNGLLFKLETQDLSEKLTRALADSKLRKRLGQKAREKILIDFDIRKTLKKENESLISLSQKSS